MAKAAKRKPKAAQDDCFLIMPISDQAGYEPGHFSRVCEQIFRPACAMAGFRAIRADEVRQTNVIHLDILKRLIEAPMALCDLSSRNPNVLFELGIRQAFDKPVVIVQEEGTERIFDVSIIRAQEYRRTLLYHTVLEDQEAISEAIKATKNAKPDSVNSIVRLLSLSAAKLDDRAAGDATGMFNALMNQISELGAQFQQRTSEPRVEKDMKFTIPEISGPRPKAATARLVRLFTAHKQFQWALESKSAANKIVAKNKLFDALMRIKGYLNQLTSDQKARVLSIQGSFLEEYPRYATYFPE